MGLAFRDFVPRLSASTTTGDAGFRDANALQSVLEAVNAWVDAEGIEVVNVETVVLPNMHDEEGSEDAALHTSGDLPSVWHQFVRVWHRTP